MNQEILQGEKRKIPIFSIAWVIPLVALIIGIWLIVENVRSNGPEITLYMKNADGIEAGNTVIKVLNVEVGRITGIALNSNQTGVVIHARMKASAKPLLRSDTLFWIVKPRIDQSGITGLGTLVSGSYIEMAPGRKPQYQDNFQVTEVPPVTSSREQGIHIRLVGHNDRLLSIGTPVLYGNIPVGTVERATFDAKNLQVHYQIFITKPNDILLGDKVHFWLSDGIDINLNSGSLKVSIPSVSTLLTGAIIFGIPPEGRGKMVSDGTEFTLYPKEADIPIPPPKENVAYLVAFLNQGVETLYVGSPVLYRGIRVGTVRRTPYFIGDDKTKLFDKKSVPILFDIDPNKIDQHDISQSAWQNKINKLVQQGLTAHLESTSLVFGQGQIVLSDDKPVKSKNTHYGQYMVIRTKDSSLADIQRQLGEVLAKINHLPIEKTVGHLNNDLAELHTILANLNSLISQQSTQNLPKELTSTLHSLQTTLKGFSPNQALYQDVQKTLQSLNQTMSKLDPVLQTLNNKPNALIFNNNTTDPIPKGHH